MVRELSDDQRSFCTHRKLQAESIFDELNNSHVGVIQRAVLHMKVRAQQCLRANGGYFEGKKQFA